MTAVAQTRHQYKSQDGGEEYVGGHLTDERPRRLFPGECHELGATEFADF